MVSNFPLNISNNITVLLLGCRVRWNFFFLLKPHFKFLIAAILRNEIGFFDETNNTSSMLSSRLESDATLLRTIVVDRSTILIMNVGLVATSFVIAFILNWRITLVVLATYPLTISGHISEVSSPSYFLGRLKEEKKGQYNINLFACCRNSSCKAMVAT